MWWASIRVLRVVVCKVWWLLLGLRFWGFFGKIVTYHRVSQRTSMAKSWSGGCRKLVGDRGFMSTFVTSCHIL